MRVQENCVDIVRPFVAELANRGITNVQVMGGVGSVALAHEATIIVPDERRVIAPDKLELPNYRGNRIKTLRDLDALVKSTDQAEVDAAQSVGEDVIGKRLQMSFFGFRPMAQFEGDARNPLMASAKRFVGDRYVLEEDGEIIAAKKALFPFAVDIPEETVETWHLSVGEHDPHPTPIPHPATTIANYITRSVSGLRRKDSDKIGRVADNVFAKAPEMRDWLLDGPGRSQIELAQAISSIKRVPGLPTGRLKIGSSIDLPPYRGSFDEHPAFVMGDSAWALRRAAMGVKRSQAVAMRGAEYCGPLISLWPVIGEPLVQGIIKNR